MACERSPRSDEGLDLPQKILLVTVDTTRADHVSAYGYQRQTTPFLAALAERSVVFTNAYTVMPTTDPAHASMLTCQYPRTHGILQNAMRRRNPDGPSLGRWLAERGYETAAITARLGLDPTLRRIEGFSHSDAPRLPQKERTAAEVLDLASRWLAERDGGRWFLWVHLWEPHKPYRPEGKARTRFAKGPVPKKRKYEDPVRFLRKGQTVSGDVIEAAVSLYDAEIWLADRAIEKLVAAAGEATPAEEPLLTMVLSDHGESLAERQAETRIGFGHGTHINDEVVRVPWLVSWPGKLAPGKLSTAVSVVDLTPTLIDLAQPGSTMQCEGRSLARALTEGTEPDPVPIVLERRPFLSRPIPGLRRRETAWVEFPWKLIAHGGEQKPRLYRLDADPGETANLAAREPEKLAELSRRLAQWEAAHPPPRGPGDRADRGDAAEREALRALGYID